MGRSLVMILDLIVAKLPDTECKWYIYHTATGSSWFEATYVAQI